MSETISFLEFLTDILMVANPRLSTQPPHWIGSAAIVGTFMITFGALPSFNTLLGDHAMISPVSLAFMIATGVLFTVLGGGMGAPGHISFLGFLAMIIRFCDGFGSGLLIQKLKWLHDFDWLPIIVGMGLYLAAPLSSDHHVPTGFWGAVAFVISLPMCLISMIGILKITENISPNSMVDIGICIIIACSLLMGPGSASDIGRLVFYLAFPAGIFFGILGRNLKTFA